MVQTNFLKFAASLVEGNYESQNYTKLTRGDQSNLNKMRRAEENAVKRKEEVTQCMQENSDRFKVNKQAIKIKCNEAFHRVDHPSNLRSNMKSMWSE